MNETQKKYQEKAHCAMIAYRMIFYFAKDMRGKPRPLNEQESIAADYYWQRYNHFNLLRGVS